MRTFRMALQWIVVFFAVAEVLLGRNASSKIEVVGIAVLIIGANRVLDVFQRRQLQGRV
jgi:hypothetical protein